MDQNASARIDPRAVVDPNQERTAIVTVIEARATARAGVAAAVVLAAVVEGGIAAVAVAVSVVQVASITVAKASLATGAESNSVRAEESHEAEAVAEVATEATVAAGVGPVPETGSNGMEAARDSFRNHLSGARVTTTATTMGTKITRGVAGGMAKEAVAVDKSYLEPTRSLLLRSDLA